MRLSELEPASFEELTLHGDVCSICYQEMVEGAVRTECKHYFHTHCLRRWLVVQDNCPMCTQPIVAKKEEEGEETLAAVEEEEGARGLVDEEERLVQLVGGAYPEEEIWEELASETSEEENAEDVEAEDEEVEFKEEEALGEEVVGDVGLRQRTVGNGQQATVGNGQPTVSCLFDGD